VVDGHAGLERKRRDKPVRRKNVVGGMATAAGSGEMEPMLDDSQDDDILESVIKSVTTPSSRQTRERRRVRAGTRMSRNYRTSFASFWCLSFLSNIFLSYPLSLFLSSVVQTVEYCELTELTQL